MVKYNKTLSNIKENLIIFLLLGIAFSGISFVLKDIELFLLFMIGDVIGFLINTLRDEYY